MTHPHDSNIWSLVATLLGDRRAEALRRAVAVAPALDRPWQARVPRAQLAMALDLILFEDLLRRVSQARAYVGDRVAAGHPIRFDHGALRTVLAPCGQLPPGEAAFTRLLEPLGYRCAETYPLDRLGLTGRAYVHRDLPEDVPQFFVSEFHPERYSAGFQAAVARTVAASADPLPLWALPVLEDLRASGSLAHDQALRLLPNLAACFDRQHPAPLWSDYQLLLAESEEMAWIATEGNAFNHITDRVGEVEALAAQQKDLGRPMKETVEVSASGRVLQTAFRSARVERAFRAPEGHLVVKAVPGSFMEFITRKPLPDGRLDLSFDTSNAQAIFKMTAPGGA